MPTCTPTRMHARTHANTHLRIHTQLIHHTHHTSVTSCTTTTITTPGLFTAHDVDDRFKTAYRILFRAGLFDPPAQVPWTDIGLDQYGAESHRQLAYDTALQSVVLLHHDGKTLPLGGAKAQPGTDDAERSTGAEREPGVTHGAHGSTESDGGTTGNAGGLKLAVLGPQADNRGGIQGATAKGGETGSSGGLCGGYRGAVCPPGPDGKPTMSCVQTIRDVITAANKVRGGSTTFAAGVPRQSNGRNPATQGTWHDNYNTSGIAAAVRLARAADVAIVVVGIDTFMEGTLVRAGSSTIACTWFASGLVLLHTACERLRTILPRTQDTDCSAD